MKARATMIGIRGVFLGALAGAVACAGPQQVTAGAPGSTAPGTTAATTCMVTPGTTVACFDGASGTSRPSTTVGSVVASTSTVGSAVASTATVAANPSTTMCMPAITTTWTGPPPSGPRPTYCWSDSTTTHPNTTPRTAPVTTTTLAPSPNQGLLQGTVVAGPTCPVERPGEPCPPTTITSGTVTAGAKTAEIDGNGTWGMLLPAGSYTVTVQTSQAMSCKPTSASVAADRVTEVTITCDTGIR